METKTNPKLLPLCAMARRVYVTNRWLKAEADSGRLPCVKADKNYLFDPVLVERVLLKRARKGANDGR